MVARMRRHLQRLPSSSLTCCYDTRSDPDSTQGSVRNDITPRESQHPPCTGFRRRIMMMANLVIVTGVALSFKYETE
jgi:hypothetical protein